MLSDDGVTAADIRVTVHRREQPTELNPRRPRPRPPIDLEAGELLARLGWLLTHSSGTIADVAHHLETRAADLDDDARERLRDDLLALHEELAPLTTLLEPVDWDAEHRRLLAGLIHPSRMTPTTKPTSERNRTATLGCETNDEGRLCRRPSGSRSLVHRFLRCAGLSRDNLRGETRGCGRQPDARLGSRRPWLGFAPTVERQPGGGSGLTVRRHPLARRPAVAA